MFCTGCGTQSADSDMFCGGCGKDAQAVGKPAIHRVGQATAQQDIPDGVRGWSWGAFLLTWIWAIGNNTWIGLLALIPYVNIPVGIWLGIKGREMAWRNGRWDNLEHFLRVQRAWSRWAVGIILTIFTVAMLFLFIAVGMGVSHATSETSNAVVQQVDAATTVRALL